jgi:hypothetical protein
MNTREMLDKVASQNYQLAMENTQLKQELVSLREALVDCDQNLSAQSRKALQSSTRELLENISLAPLKQQHAAKAAANA